MVDTSLWRFAVAVYNGPGVAKECLSLQDRFALNVNLLLCGIYLGSEFGIALSRRDLSAAGRAIARWQIQIVNPLREMRRLLKQTSARNGCRQGPSTKALRLQIKNAELESERLAAAMLTKWFRPRLAGWPRGERTMAVLSNSRTVLAHYGAEEAELPQRLIRRALALNRSSAG